MLILAKIWVFTSINGVEPITYVMYKSIFLLPLNFSGIGILSSIIKEQAKNLACIGIQKTAHYVLPITLCRQVTSDMLV